MTHGEKRCLCSGFLHCLLRMIELGGVAQVYRRAEQVGIFASAERLVMAAAPPVHAQKHVSSTNSDQQNQGSA